MPMTFEIEIGVETHGRLRGQLRGPAIATHLPPHGSPLHNTTRPFLILADM